jgi:predicted nucleotidyltransferase
MPPEIKKVLRELKQGFHRIYGDALKEVYLYGSYARGDAQPESDIDVLLVLKGNFNYLEMLKLSDDFAVSVSLENDIVVSRAFASEQEFEKKQSPFLINVRREGIAV